jgi:thiol-disulfide isomerase/thioredoxin
LGGKGMGEFKLTVKLATEAEAKLATLQQQVLRLFQANPDQRKQIVAELAGHLQERGPALDRGDLNMVFQTLQILQFQKDDKATGAAALRFADMVGKSSDGDVANSAKLLRGVAKRLTLVGNEMQIKGKTMDGKDFDLRDLKGKVVLVDFWATWCGPCIAEMPHIKAMHAKYNPQGFEVIAISLDASEPPVRQFMANKDIPWPCIFNGAGKESLGLTEEYGVMAIPLAILVDRDGRVVSLNARGPELTRLLEELIEGKK